MWWERKERWQPTMWLRYQKRNNQKILEQKWTRVTWTKYGCFGKNKFIEEIWHPVSDDIWWEGPPE